MTRLAVEIYSSKRICDNNGGNQRWIVWTVMMCDRSIIGNLHGNGKVSTVQAASELEAAYPYTKCMSSSV